MNIKQCGLRDMLQMCAWIIALVVMAAIAWTAPEEYAKIADIVAPIAGIAVLGVLFVLVERFCNRAR